MPDIRLIGLVIYTYAPLEQRVEAVWNWIEAVSSWTGIPYDEYVYCSRKDEIGRVRKASTSNLAALHVQLRSGKPWSLVNLGWPSDTLHTSAIITAGYDVAIMSRPQPRQGNERYRAPSYVSIILVPEVLRGSSDGVNGLLALGASAWQAIDGIYGFVDVETGIPPHDDIVRNIGHIYSNLVPTQYDAEFRQWYLAMPALNRKVWKAFWGNFFGKEHIRDIGGMEELRLTDPHHRLLPEHEQQAYEHGIDQLRACRCHYGWHGLANGGVLLTLSPSPLDLFNKEVQVKRMDLQGLLSERAIALTST